MRIRPALLLLLLLASPVRADELATVPQLSVTGDAELQVTADRLRLSVGVVTEGDSAEAALKENSARLQAVKNALLQEGLTEGEMETGNFRVEPRWASPPRQPPSDWRPKIVGYTVVNSLKLRTTRLDGAGRLIAAATEAGANEIGSLSFDLAEPRRHRGEAIRQATAAALADARALAEAAGVRLVRVASLILDQNVAEPLPQVRFAMAEMADTPPPVIPGEVTVRATVRMVFEVAPAAGDTADEK